MKQIRQAPLIHLLSQVKIPKNSISLGQGIPFFGPPNETIVAAKNALTQPIGYQYTPDQGLLLLREIITEKIQKEQQVYVDPERNVLVTAGANQGFITAVFAITNPGDEIIFFTPTYFNYVMGVQLAGCTPVFVDTTNRFQPDCSILKSKISKKTKAIVSISPNNPTGAVWTTESLKTINELCADHHLYHISDEVYEYFLYEDAVHTSPLRFDGSLSYTISLFSLSKSFGISGYRIGYMVFPEQLHADLLKIMDTIGICAPAPAQLAAIQTIPLGDSYCKSFMATLLNNRRLVQKMLSSVSFIDTVWTKGAYYFFVTIGSCSSSWTIAKRLIEEYAVIVLPGSIFDNETSSFRLSYGNLTEYQMNEALNRLVNGLQHIL